MRLCEHSRVPPTPPSSPYIPHNALCNAFFASPASSSIELDDTSFKACTPRIVVRTARPYPSKHCFICQRFSLVIRLRPRILLSRQRDSSIVTEQTLAKFVAEHWKALGVGRNRVARLFGGSESAISRDPVSTPAPKQFKPPGALQWRVSTCSMTFHRSSMLWMMHHGPMRKAIAFNPDGRVTRLPTYSQRWTALVRLLLFNHPIRTPRQQSRACLP